MPTLPQKKVGIVACSGEELAEGTVTRLAALKVLEQLRPLDTVTICLPLFLAGGEGDRAFARFYPTIALDGCHERCAARATERYSSKPAAGIVVTEIVAGAGLARPEGCRRLNEAGHQAVDLVAGRVAELVDEILVRRWSRRAGEFVETSAPVPSRTGCACGSGVPVQQIQLNGQSVTLVALPAIFEQFQQEGKRPDATTSRALLERVRIYNAVPAAEEDAYLAALERAYTDFCDSRETRT
jgi:uncharacterized metal-binding protein